MKKAYATGGRGATPRTSAAMPVKQGGKPALKAKRNAAGFLPAGPGYSCIDCDEAPG